MITTTQKAKGPASVRALPSLGSTNPQKDTEMNEVTNTTAATAKSKPTDKQIVDAMDDLMGDVHFLSTAAMVADDYATMAFRSGNHGCFLDQCQLDKDQVAGILYMLRHVRDLADKLEASWDKAFGLEGGR
jgi:hypothetical protein